jgi:formate-nitrite transporter family protein
MGLTGLGVARVRAILGSGTGEELVSFLVYPIGFIAVIIGRAQLFTENTLYPVVRVLDEDKHHRHNLVKTLRLWGGVVFSANVAGAFLFALLALKSGALSADIAAQLVTLGNLSVTGSAAHFFGAGWSVGG